MSGSACETYVRWYNQESEGNWATWEPGDKVVPGNTGTFSEQLRFWPMGVLPGVDCKSARKAGPVSYSSGADISFTAAAGGKSLPSLDGIAGLGGDFRLEASRAGACYLHLDEMVESWVDNEEQILTQVRDRLSDFELNTIIVMSTLEASRGFAFITKRRGASLEVSASAAAAPLASAAISIRAGHGGSRFHLTEFGKGSTPVFSRTFRVDHSMWHRLVPWDREGPVLIRPDGKRYSGPLSPSDLAGVPARARRYDPRRSAITPQVLASIPVEDLFEEVTSIADLGELEPAGVAASNRNLAWFAMVPLPSPSGLRAGGSDDIIAERSTPDGQLDIYFRPGPAGVTGYQSEVVLRIPRPLPVIVSVRYEADGRQHEILIPIAATPLGPPVAEVYLRGLAPDMPWEISAPAQLTGGETWPATTVAASIQDTPDSGRDNWRAYRELAQRDMQQVITRALGS